MPPDALHLLEQGEFRCPACGARQQLSDRCRRCRCDLSLVRKTAEAWLGERKRCFAHLAAGEAAAAASSAATCYEIAPAVEAVRLLALCRLLSGDFPAALQEYRLASRLAS